MTNILTVQPCFNPFFIEDRQIKKYIFLTSPALCFPLVRDGLEITTILEADSIFRKQ